MLFGAVSEDCEDREILGNQYLLRCGAICLQAGMTAALRRRRRHSRTVSERGRESVFRSAAPSLRVPDLMAGLLPRRHEGGRTLPPSEPHLPEAARPLEAVTWRGASRSGTTPKPALAPEGRVRDSVAPLPSRARSRRFKRSWHRHGGSHRCRNATSMVPRERPHAGQPEGLSAHPGARPVQGDKTPISACGPGPEKAPLQPAVIVMPRLGGAAARAPPRARVTPCRRRTSPSLRPDPPAGRRA